MPAKNWAIFSRVGSHRLSERKACTCQFSPPVPPALAISRIQVAQAKRGTLLAFTHHLEHGGDRGVGGHGLPLVKNTLAGERFAA